MTNQRLIPPIVLKGRLAFITGAGQGNGQEIAIGLARAGAKVIVTDVNEALVQQTATIIRSEGNESWHFVLDVTDANQCFEIAKKIGTQIGKVDLLVNNAGIIIREDSNSPNAAANWRKVFDVNVNGTFNVTQAFLQSLRETQGTIVNIASITSFIGQGGPLGYSPSKGAIKMYTQSLAAELGKDGIRVNALAPGLIETPMNTEARKKPQFLEHFKLRTPLGRTGNPIDLVGPVVFLSSSMSEYITGVTLPVDGGYLAV